MEHLTRLLFPDILCPLVVRLNLFRAVDRVAARALRCHGLQCGGRMAVRDFTRSQIACGSGVGWPQSSDRVGIRASSLERNCCTYSCRMAIAHRPCPPQPTSKQGPNAKLPNLQCPMPTWASGFFGCRYRRSHSFRVHSLAISPRLSAASPEEILRLEPKPI